MHFYIYSYHLFNLINLVDFPLFQKRGGRGDFSQIVMINPPLFPFAEAGQKPVKRPPGRIATHIRGKVVYYTSFIF